MLTTKKQCSFLVNFCTCITIYTYCPTKYLPQVMNTLSASCISYLRCEWHQVCASVGMVGSPIGHNTINIPFTPVMFNWYYRPNVFCNLNIKSLTICDVINYALRTMSKMSSLILDE